MKTNKKDFKLFKKEVRKWVEILGLKGWKVVFEYIESEGNCAFYIRNSPGRIITISLSADYDDLLYTEKGIKLSAFHEVIEGLLLARFDDMIDRRKYSGEEIEEARHEVTRILEHVLFPKY